MTEAFELLMDTLTSHGKNIVDRRQNHAVAQCPAHDDGRPSLGVDAKDGKVLLHCYAGCETGEIVDALGIELKDLFDQEPDGSDSRQAVHVCTYTYKGSQGEVRYYVDRLYPKTFRMRKPGTQPGDYAKVGDLEPILYRADEVWQCMKNSPEGCTVYLVDGEKDVETAKRHGLVATTPPGFGKKWRDSYSNFLRHAKEVIIVADQDPVKPDGTPGKGQAYAIEARNGLKSRGVKVKIVAPAVGKDLTDHFAAGYTEADFQVEPTASVRPRGMSASDLMAKEFDPISFAVDKILPAGLTICAGSPKAGKSWLMLDLCIAVAAGGPALSHLPTEQGCTLYLAREDTYRRLQSRMALIMSGTMEGPKALEVIPQEQDWPGGEEGLSHLTEWAEECGSPRLVVIDTLAKVEPDMGEDRNRGAYAGNYTMMARYKQWADLHNCAVVMVHHDRKQQGGDKGGADGWMDEDPFTRISGTRGLTGAADTLWFLESKRGCGEGRLHITGRDVVEQHVELRKSGPLWTATHLPE